MEPYVEGFLKKTFWRATVRVFGPNLTLDVLCYLGLHHWGMI